MVVCERTTVARNTRLLVAGTSSALSIVNVSSEKGAGVRVVSKTSAASRFAGSIDMPWTRALEVIFVKFVFSVDGQRPQTASLIQLTLATLTCRRPTKTVGGPLSGAR